MTLVMPEGVPSLGATKVKAILTIASQAAPSLATEVNAAGSVDISLHLYPTGWAPGGAAAKGTRPPRLGSKKTREIFNRTTYTLGTLQYVFDPQAATSVLTNKARTLLVEGLKIHLLERLGPDAETVDFAVADKTLDHYVVLGPQIISSDRADENGEFTIMQDVIYYGSNGPVAGVIAA
jgi:hypothetical protein